MAIWLCLFDGGLVGGFSAGWLDCSGLFLDWLCFGWYFGGGGAAFLMVVETMFKQIIFFYSDGAVFAKMWKHIIFWPRSAFNNAKPSLLMIDIEFSHCCMARVTAAVRCLPLTAAIGFLMFPYVLDGCPSKLTFAEITRSIYFCVRLRTKNNQTLFKNEKIF